jgi:hypothetical protein
VNRGSSWPSWVSGGADVVAACAAGEVNLPDARFRLGVDDEQRADAETDVLPA